MRRPRFGYTLVLLLLAALMAEIGTAQTRLGINGTRFTINNAPVFLVGLSYYGGLGAMRENTLRDLKEIQAYHFNWIRVWATWEIASANMSAVDRKGKARQPYLQSLQWLVAECNRCGLVVDVTLSANYLDSPEAHLQAVETLVAALKSSPNWYLDLANERNIGDARFVDFEVLKRLRERVRELDPTRLVTASQGGDIGKDELQKYLRTAQVDFICPHRPRHAKSPAETEAKSKEYFAWMKEIGRKVPLHYQEPFRRGYAQWNPKFEDLLTDLRGAKAGGAAGWCLHNGDERTAEDKQPMRSFDLRQKRLFEQLDDEERKVLDAVKKSRLDMETAP